MTATPPPSGRQAGVAEPSEYLMEITTMAETTPLASTPLTRVEPMPMTAEPGSVALMKLIERAAMSADFDVAKLEKLLDVRDRWEANEARKAYVVALSAFKKEPPTIVKNRTAAFGSRSGGAGTEYGYATLAQVAGIIAPALAKHGLSHGWSVKQDETGIAVTCTLTHELGHSESVTMRAPADTSGSKNAIQSIGSTVTYLERYSLLGITGLATIDQDDDAHHVVEMISPDQKERLIALMREVNADVAKFLNFLGVEYIDMLPAKRFDDAVAALEKKRKPA
jgi:hypothetical protein